MQIPSKRVEIIKVNHQQVSQTDDVLSIEEPLEIRLLQDKNLTPVSVTMRTPGHDAELAVGFFYTEGILKGIEEVKEVHHPTENTVVIELAKTVSVDPSVFARNFYTTSSCGVCGKASIDAIRVRHDVVLSNCIVSYNVIKGLAEVGRSSQSIFKETGGCHASSIFSVDGNLLLTREDVGRHNALDKVIGHCLLNKIDMTNCILLVSGRASFELLQKAAVAGIPILVAIGAPSSLAVELAQEAGITLVGFLKEQEFNIYSHPDRIRTV